MKNILPTEVNTAISKLEKAGHKAYVVGGAVRDFLLGKQPHDFDLATSATPVEIKEVFSDCKTFDTGIRHGTILVIINDRQLEITTFRTDGNYSDNRHPDSVSFTGSIEEDLARRDFTVNAIAYSPSDGIIDPFGGQEDLKNKIIRAVGNPEKRFSEDALRIARAVRFAAQLGFMIEENTDRALFKLRDTLKNIAVERFYTELIKTICAPAAGVVLLAYHEIFSVWIPEIEPMVSFDQKNKHHIHSVWMHTVIVLSSVDNKPALRLAALLHDSGKPVTFKIGDDNQGHFYHHYAASCNIAEKVFERLRVDHATAAYALDIIRHHDHYLTNDEKRLKRVLSRFGEEYMYDLIKFQKADNMGQHPDFRFRQDELDEVKKTVDRLIEEDSCFKLKDLAVSGNDLIDLGIPAGREIGKILTGLLDAVMDEELENKKEILLAKAKEWHLTA